ncbi:hypothetical protein L486_03058 [Kwoniella mangroviensis CBS 10435]|uniref:Uncharacterized protein n=1 Tax=Kwoniella mangroviensis CBS 10435 TaxID=1331196 RepID=A0A1B9ISQ7_9TREE|nr:hypothetical protein L486_03058 [Kwoniella mangroviensis CBS 10435]
MGGNAFNTPAQRLPQAQYDALKAHVFAALATSFEQIESPRNLRFKTDHGDLDILVGSAGSIPGGDEEWVPQTAENIKDNKTDLPKLDDSPNPDPLLLEVIAKLDLKPANAPQAEPSSDVVSPNDGGTIKLMGTGKMLLGKEVEDLRGLCGEMRQNLKATGWRRRGPEISFKVPCQIVTGDEAVESNAEKFYQIDVLLVSPESFDFNHLMSSYSSTGVLLGRVLRQLSKSFTLHLTHLVVRHLPYFGIPPIDITLTSSPEEFCEWLGLDYQKWKTEGESWVTEVDFWKWMTDAREDSPAAQAIRRMAARSKSTIDEGLSKKRRKRADFADRFYEWLQKESDWAPRIETGDAATLPRDSVPPSPAPLPTLGPDGEGGTSAPSLPTINQVFATPGSGKSGPPASSYNPDNPSFIDPEHPKPLDSRASAAIDYWKKQEVYEAILEERKTVAKVLADRQRDRVDRNDKATDGENKHQEEVKDW